MRERLAYAFCLNFFVAVAEGASLFEVARLRGVMMLTFYTECANILALLTSLIFCVAAVRGLLQARPIPHWVRTLRLVSVVMLGVVVGVVVLVLAPLLGGSGGLTVLLFGGTMFYHHLFCPALSMLSFFLLEGGAAPRRWQVALSLLPTVLYAVALYLLNASAVVSGPYPFFMVRDLPLWLIVAAGSLIFLGSLGGAILLRRLAARADERMRGISPT